jgi:thiol-disulfide isomerase/thioredoxin
MVKIEVLGTGCAKCKSLTKTVEKAVQELGIKAEIVKVMMLALALIMVLSPAMASTDTQIIVIIHSPPGAKCAAADRVLTDVLADYENVSIEDIIFSSEEGKRIIKEHKVKDVPSIIIGDSVIGYRDYDGNETKLKMLIKAALEGQNISRLNEDQSDSNLDEEMV